MTTAPDTAPAWLLDTSVVLDIHDAAVVSALPDVTAISVVTLAELMAGPLMTDDPAERAIRQQRLLDINSTYEPLPVDEDVATAFGAVVAAAHRSGQHSRRRQLDLLIAASAVAHDLPLATRHAEHLLGLGDIVDIREV